jgi:hypothetical protein
MCGLLSTDYCSAVLFGLQMTNHYIKHLRRVSRSTGHQHRTSGRVKQPALNRRVAMNSASRSTKLPTRSTINTRGCGHDWLKTPSQCHPYVDPWRRYGFDQIRSTARLVGPPLGKVLFVPWRSGEWKTMWANILSSIEPVWRDLCR